jgi:asparagine synthase (glutamine-hydrolysing)
MCGIVGVAGKQELSNTAWFDLGLSLIARRGPDFGAKMSFGENKVLLGHRRLSIIDLSEMGHQPMIDETHHNAIVFNGEIYNFLDLRQELAAQGVHFQSSSDTEVVLKGYAFWGNGLFERLEGMFALAIYDANHNKLVLARDRVGEKPLFYAAQNGIIRFASELKALLADESLKRKINKQALDCLLAFGYVPGDLCILEGFNKLPPAHFLEFSLESGESTVQRYWDLPELLPSSNAMSETEMVDQLYEVLYKAIERQLVADVPVGILLSGGVDSSLVTAIASKIKPGVKTFSVGFDEAKEYDETKYAQFIADHFKTDHHVLQANEVDFDLINKLAVQYDEPIFDSSMIPTSLVCEQIRKYCTVALGGDGGDELFGGYHTNNRMVQLDELGKRFPIGLINGIGAIGNQLTDFGARGHTYFGFLKNLDKVGVPRFGWKLEWPERNKLFPKSILPAKYAEQLWHDRSIGAKAPIRRLNSFEFKNYLPEDILVKTDRASMLHSLELRSPFLDKLVIDFAFGRVPDALKADKIHRKLILKKLADRILPKGFDVSRKQGFGIPIHQHLIFGKWRKESERILCNAHMGYDAGYIKGLFKRAEKGQAVAEQLFGLLVVELWARHYQVEI